MTDTVPRPGDRREVAANPVSGSVSGSIDEGVERKLEAGLPSEQDLALDTGPVVQSPRSNPALNRTAVKIGVLLGTAVHMVRTIPCQVQAVPRSIGSLREGLRAKSTELREEVSETVSEWQRRARANVQRARVQTVQYAQENPFQVIAAVAGVAFLMGAGLRIWRSRLD